jgi:hypothetical protein
VQSVCKFFEKVNLFTILVSFVSFGNLLNGSPAHVFDTSLGFGVVNVCRDLVVQA